MFFYRKKHLRKRKYASKKNSFYVLAAVCMALGMLSGYLNADSSNVSWDNTVFSVAVFQFSFLRNAMILLLFLANAFSLIGFPLTMVATFASGYMITYSTVCILLHQNISKMHFLIRCLPYVGFTVISYLFFAEKVLKYSKNLFSIYFFNYPKAEIGQKTGALFLHFVISAAGLILAALYESYILYA